jgi:predicted dienelactone hydrolase
MKSLIALLLLTTAASADSLPGFDRVTVTAAHRPSAMEARVWYPAASETYPAALGANPAFLGTKVQVGPIAAPGRHPLVIISHGSGGNIDGLGWLSEGLVARGAVVAGLNHPRSTSGDSNPRAMPLVWTRTADVAALIDTLVADPVFGPVIDADRITALGFSLGGATVLAAGGARLDRDAYAAYCDRTGAAATDCGFMLKGGVDIHSLPPEWEADMRVPAVSQVIAVDPGFGYAMTDASLAAMPVKVHLINLGDPSTLPPAINAGQNGADLVSRIPGASYQTVAPAWHFSFLGLCTQDAPALLEAEGEDPICDDPAGSDRRVIHDRLIADIAVDLGL